MRLTELFAPEDLLVHFAPTDKWDALGQLVEHLAKNGRIPPEATDKIREAVLARERSMSTGMENGIAIPHAAVEGLENLGVALGVVDSEAGLSFESNDGLPARLIVLLVIPKNQKLMHIRTLAAVARVLGKAEVREQMYAAETAQDAWCALRDGEV